MKTLATLLASWAFASIAIATAAEAKPNIVFVLFDDMGYGQPKCYREGTEFSTPNIDRLAKRLCKKSAMPKGRKHGPRKTRRNTEAEAFFPCPFVPSVDSVRTFYTVSKEGMRFTDAHSAASVCTPKRYGVMTGRYPSRIGQ